MGGDRPKIDRAVRRLRERFGDDSVARLSAEDASGEDAVAACNAIGLFETSGRLVLVDGVEQWKAADGKAVADYLASPAPATVLALVASELRKDSQLAKACESILERSTRSGEIPMLVGRLVAHVRRVQACQRLDANGVRAREAAAELKMHPFAAEKAFGQARNFSVEELREAIVRLSDLDFAIKGGSRL